MIRNYSDKMARSEKYKTKDARKKKKVKKLKGHND